MSGEGADPAALFRMEAGELLEMLEQGLLDLGQSGHDPERVNAVFRALHTLKGSGAMFGFARLAAFLHEFETAFDDLRQGAAAPSAELISVALDAADHAAALVEGAEGEEIEARGAALLQLLGETLTSPEDARPAQALPPSPAPSLSPASTGAQGDPVPPPAAPGWQVRFTLAEGALIDGADPLLLLDELRELCGPQTPDPAEVFADLSDIPPLDRLDPEVCRIRWEARLPVDLPRAAIEDVFMFLDETTPLEIAPLSHAPPALDPSPQAAPGLSADGATEPDPEPAAIPAAPMGESRAPLQADPAPSREPPAAPRLAPAASAPPARPAASSAAPPSRGRGAVRVAAERLDELMDRVGELVIAQSRLNQIAETSESLELKSVAEEMQRLSAGLRDATMGIRMVPFGSLFGRFRRLIHDLGAELGKDIALETSGEETELDKTVIDQLADPLVHLIRNACDHGLEGRESRLAAGKPAAGRIRLSAAHVGGEVVIKLEDDGAGLDAGRIRRRAETAGLISSDQPLTEAEIHRLIFEPGFSTADKVTSLSGRGVGMDVVKRTVESLRGAIDVDSAAGQGATVTLRLPLTLAIIDGLVVRVGAERYVLPLSAVEECVELPAEAASRQGRSFLDIRGALAPFLTLRTLFGVETGEGVPPPDPHPKAVIVTWGDKRVGLVVDQILGDSQTVIKQLSPLHRSLRSFSGATILGDGAVALILDVTHLVAAGQAREARERARLLEPA